MVSTADWAIRLDHSVADNPSAMDGTAHHFPRAASEIAVRAIILQGVVAVASKVSPEPIIDWFQQQGIWDAVSPTEKRFLSNIELSQQDRINFRWRQEAEWALLWMISKVESLGLPTHLCDTRRMVDEIIPALGSDIAPFVDSATLRPTSELLAEDLRTYDLWCALASARRKNEPIPDDLNVDVLYERRYAFEWLDSIDEWDSVTCDA
jgi:hypothetical protein